MFIPRVNETLTIGNETYYFTAHPAAKDMPYGQTGRKATVFQLQGRDGKKRALKVFMQKYRLEENLFKASELLKYAAFPGLSTCERFVISNRQFPSLIKQNRDLNYSVLMPWIEGQTWQDIVLNKTKLDRDFCLETALELNRVLATMEVSQIAHCDLSGPNIILRPSGFTDFKEDPLSLIDLEEMYAPDLTKPTVLPAGSAGYAHSTSSNGLWSQYADRFAGSILLANMLAWSDSSVIEASYGENYFSPDEMHTNCTRYQKLSDSLEKTWGKATSELFSTAWYSEELKDCPSFVDWAGEFDLEIEEIKLPDPQPLAATPPQPEPESTDSIYKRQPSWQATNYSSIGTKPFVNQTPIKINSNSPVAGFRPLYGVPQNNPSSTPIPQRTQTSNANKPNLRTDFTEMNRLADWIEDNEQNSLDTKSQDTMQGSVTPQQSDDTKTWKIILIIAILIIILIAINSL